LLELGIGIFGLISIPLIHLSPPLYFKIYRAFHLSPSVYFFFQFLLCSGIMLIPTILMGATFPVVSKKVTASFDEMGRWVGNAYFFNTFGAIIGSFSAGFILIPLFGVRMAAVIAACLNILVALTMITLSKTRLKGAFIGILILCFATPLAVALLSKEEEWPISYYIAQRYKDYGAFQEAMKSVTVFVDKDYKEGRVKLWKTADGFLLLQAGGKIEGTGSDDMVNTLLLAYLPIAFHPEPKSFLTIGLGAGVTLQAAKEHVKDQYLVEINRGVLDAISRFGPPGLLNGVEVIVNDARNFLLLTEKKFDIISSEPSYPTDSSVGNLFTKEFYDLAVSRLNPDGVFCQWVPYYQLTDDDVRMMIKTFASSFKYMRSATLPSKEILLLGSNSPFKCNAQEIIKRVNQLNTSGLALPYALPTNPEQMQEAALRQQNVPVNTDDRPLLEFHVVMNLLTGQE
jgi:spermidine synthase